MNLSFCDVVLKLQEYWRDQGCLILQPYDLPVGAGTFYPSTFLKVLDVEPWSVAYVAPSRRPTDGRYGENPNRLGSYYQFQVVIKPSPKEAQNLYLGSLKSLGLNLESHDIRFVEDNWESPTLGAWGLGWEVWLDGMEITQFTYFQQVGGLACEQVALEITYGLERLVTYIQGVDNVLDIIWNRNQQGNFVRYADMHLEREYEFSKYHFEIADTQILLDLFAKMHTECQSCLDASLPLVAYDFVILSSHFFNILDARKAISVSQRQEFILKIRNLARSCALLYKEQENERMSRLKGSGNSKGSI